MYVGAIVRACACRPQEHLDADEWTDAWTVKMDEYMQAMQSLPSPPTLSSSSSSSSSSSASAAAGAGEAAKAAPLLCAYCGYEESYLGTQFVMGQTWQVPFTYPLPLP